MHHSPQSKKIFMCSLVFFLFLFSVLLPAGNTQSLQVLINYDPLVDVQVSFTVSTIRSLEAFDDLFDFTKTVGREKPPSLYLIVFINDEVFESPVWPDSFVVHTNLSFVADVSNYEEIVSIRVGLWEKNPSGSDLLWDITHRPEPSYATLQYSIKTGHWTGDDYVGDPSGYGRLNGYDDGNYDKKRMRVAELFFDITQNDYDGDGIPYWTEVNVYGTDPTVDDTGIDYSGDGVPIEWEHRWGYDPFTHDDHKNLDSSGDGISNYEKFLTASYGYRSDPFRIDIFLEIGCMADSPTGQSSRIPDEAIEMLHHPFHRRNYVVHVNRSGIIAFAEKTTMQDLLFIYQQYFLGNGSGHWKRSVFHYGLFVYETFPKGFAFSGDVEPYMGYHPGTNAFVISSSVMQRNTQRFFSKSLPYYYAAATLHELGHNFGFRWGSPFGVDAQLGKYPWHPMYYVFRNYRSVMNYRYTYKIFDYSDGSHGFLDHDDWEALDLRYFLYPEEITSGVTAQLFTAGKGDGRIFVR